MRWLSAAVLTLLVAGCASPAPSGWPFLLLTGNAPKVDGRCFSHETAMFVLDRTYGLAVEWDDGTGHVPIAWPRGFTARWVGPQIQVFDREGRSVAETGRVHQYWSAGRVQPEDWVGVPVPPAGAYDICHGIIPQSDDGGFHSPSP